MVLSKAPQDSTRVDGSGWGCGRSRWLVFTQGLGQLVMGAVKDLASVKMGLQSKHPADEAVLCLIGRRVGCGQGVIVA